VTFKSLFFVGEMGLQRKSVSPGVATLGDHDSSEEVIAVLRLKVKEIVGMMIDYKKRLYE